MIRRRTTPIEPDRRGRLMTMASMEAAAAARLRPVPAAVAARATASARNPCQSMPPSRPTAGPGPVCRAPPSPANRTSTKRARSTAAPRPRRRACHTVDLTQSRTRPVDRTKRPSGPGTLGRHNLIYEVGPCDQTRRPYTRDTKALALPLPRCTPLVTAVVFPACRSSGSPRRSGAARAPAISVSRLLVVD